MDPLPLEPGVPAHPRPTRPRCARLAGVAIACAVLAACSGGAIAVPDGASSGGTSGGGNSSGSTSSGGTSSGGTSGGGTSSGGTSSGGTGDVIVTVVPGSFTMSAGASRTFTCTVTGAADTSCRWSVLEGAAGGAVTAAGVYTAPASAGTYHVVATSRADPDRSSSATVLVTTSGGCTDACPAPNAGVSWECEKRFMYGINWAWGEWGADFGGIAAWNKPGVKAASAAFDERMKTMKAAGVNVIRWWMFPRFLTESIHWGADGAPSGIGGTLLDDVREALRLADVNDLYLMLTPFSFDNFRPTTSESGLPSPGIRPIVQSAALRRSLLESVMKPVAQAVEASPYRRRMIAWDLINEPEWAVTGPSLYGDPAFEPTSSLEPVTHAEMQTFLVELAATLRASSTALITVGGAAIKWPKAWSRVGVDFYQLHYYDWVYEWFPYTTVTLASVGLTDRPVVLGEYPAKGLSAMNGHPARSAAEFSADLWSLGYAGALAWAFNDPAFPFSPSAIRSFHDQHVCETAF